MADLFGIVVWLTALLGFYVIGSTIERRHFRDLERREELLRNVVVTTFETPEDWGIDGAELVFGNVVVSLDYFKRFLASIRSLFGGRMRAYEPLMDRGRREALLRMTEAAREGGYGHIVNVRLETSRLASARGNGKGTAGIEVLAYGTALRVTAAR